jgi:hypothetical protein
MAVSVDHLSTEVIAEPEPSSSGAAAPPATWDLMEQAREAYSAVMRTRGRTAAEGFDD